MLIFGKANAKLVKLEKKYGKVSTFSTLSGHFCPYAKECKSSAVEGKDGKVHIEDGPHTVFRCFSASQEVLFPNVYTSRKTNSDNIAKLLGSGKLVDQFIADIPKGTKVVRVHVAGDFRTQSHFDAFIEIAKRCPHIIFYAYTKSLPFWVKRLGKIPTNFVLTASYGGYRDDLINKHNLRFAKVVFSRYEAKKLGLPIDIDDYHAVKSGGSFALLIHGVQPKGTKAAKRWDVIKKKEGGYSR